METEYSQANSTKNESKLMYSYEGIIPGIPKSQIDKDVFKIFGEAFTDYEKSINCVKIAENELTKRKDLFVEISSPTKIKPSGLSFSYFQYTVKTSPIGYSVIRKLSDFEFLHETIPKYNNIKFNPLLPKFPINLDDDSEKKILFLQYYLNALIEGSYYRSLPIVLNFLSLPQSEWDTRIKTYQKVKEITEISQMYNLEETFNIKINHEDDFKAMKIKDDIKQKEEIYKKLNDNWDALFPIMEKMSICLKNISQNFLNLQNIYLSGHKSNEVLANCYQQLYLIIKTWGEDYVKQKNFLKNHFKYFFKYISKETNSFLKNFENYEDKKEEYKKLFMKYQKNEAHTQKDKDNLEQKRNLYGIHLVHVIDEFNKLSERQGKRVNRQFFLFNKEKELIFQDYNNFYRLFNFKESYSLPDMTISNIRKQNDILNLNISKISKVSKNDNNENNRYNENEEKKENSRLVNSRYSDKNVKINNSRLDNSRQKENSRFENSRFENSMSNGDKNIEIEEKEIK